MQLRTIAPIEYARAVLPLSAPLWSGRRDLDTYVEQTVAIARSRYGKRFYRTVGLFDGSALVSSCKRYERIVRVERRRLRAVGFGAVYTPDGLRGRGYASAMLAMSLDDARARGFDAAYLFSDIRPHFYEQLGFRRQPSRTLFLRADVLPKSRIVLSRLTEDDWPQIVRCFNARDRRRPWSFARTPLVWNWIRTRIEHGSEHARGAPAHFVVRANGQVRAYVLGVRVPETDSYVLDEVGCASHDASLVPALLRGAAGDLGKISGWLPPDGVRSLLPRGRVRDRRVAIFMIAPLSPEGKRWCALSERESDADGVWAADHV